MFIRCKDLLNSNRRLIKLRFHGFYIVNSRTVLDVRTDYELIGEYKMLCK